ncbi:MAG TPA: hypothetical protein VMU57_06910 [Edaphobacter sp.]|nr:hypothetical protein [Edaphobacter sp.]HUZ94628.1 hypothetical protein [Edaphobacter sp.]
MKQSNIPQAAPRSETRLLRIHSVLEISVGPLLKVKLEFFIHLAMKPASREEKNNSAD